MSLVDLPELLIMKKIKCKLKSVSSKLLTNPELTFPGVVLDAEPTQPSGGEGGDGAGGHSAVLVAKTHGADGRGLHRAHQDPTRVQGRTHRGRQDFHLRLQQLLHRLQKRELPLLLHEVLLTMSSVTTYIRL